MNHVFGDAMLVLHNKGSQHYSFVGYKNIDPRGLLTCIASSSEDIGIVPLENVDTTSVTVPTDDWPYVFFRTQKLPVEYLLILIGLIALSVVPLRIVFKEVLRIEWGFFFMGAAFLLVETNSVVRVALIAGTTWIVNSAVFAGVLLFIFLANWVVARWRITSYRGAFIGLASSLLVSYFFPFSDLLSLPNYQAVVIASLVLTLPVLFSGIIFSVFLRCSETPSRALASNLFGTVLGGFTEYVSMYSGNRSVTLLALAAYLLAYLCFTRTRP